MKSYSITRMRKECQGTYRLFLVIAVIFGIESAFFGAMWKVMDHAETGDALLLICVFLGLSLFLMGGYFVVSDPKWMRKHTLYGKTLAKLGDAETLMREIDREAEAMLYECHSFALLKQWLVVYENASRRTRGFAAIESRPIPIDHLVRIAWSQDQHVENAGYWVQFEIAHDADVEVFVWEKADIEALRAWGASIREKQYL